MSVSQIFQASVLYFNIIFNVSSFVGHLPTTSFFVILEPGSQNPIDYFSNADPTHAGEQAQGSPYNSGMKIEPMQRDFLPNDAIFSVGVILRFLTLFM